MRFEKKIQAMAHTGAATRCIEENKKSIIKADTKTNSLALATGDILSYQMLNGVILHGGSTIELQDYQITSTVSKSMIIVILLEGQLTFNYDDLDIQLKSDDKHTGIAVNFCKPVCLGREFKKGNKVTKLNILLPTSWLETFTKNDCRYQHLTENHLASHSLNITEAMKVRSQEILQLHSCKSLIDKLKIESQVQLLLTEIFQQLSIKQTPQNDSTHTNHLASSDHALDYLIKYIELNIDKDLTPAALSELSAMSVSNIQRRFKKTLGYSIQSYIRRRRLDLARQKLERGLITITEAAYTCGYRYPSNFTNAYKKTFGYPPQMSAKK
ncbi:MAG: AraC family transcriptional regulator [Marinomonas sp.]